MPRKSRGKSSLGVLWTLPGYKKPFASTTQADSDFFSIVKNFRWSDLYREFAYFSPEQRTIVDTFIEKGYGDWTLEETGVQ